MGGNDRDDRSETDEWRIWELAQQLELSFGNKMDVTAR